MSQRTEGPNINGLATAATAQYLRVKMVAAGTWTVAGDEAFDGFANIQALAAGDPISVRHKYAGGTQIAVAGGAIAIGDTVTTAASGKCISGTTGVVDFGRAISAAAADGDLFEVLVNA